MEDFLAVGASGEATVVMHGRADRRLWVVEVVAEMEKEEKGGRKWEESERGKDKMISGFQI